MRSVALLSKLLCFNSMMEEGKKMIRFFFQTLHVVSDALELEFYPSQAELRFFWAWPSWDGKIKNSSHIQSAKKTKWRYMIWRFLCFQAHSMSKSPSIFLRIWLYGRCSARAVMLPNFIFCWLAYFLASAHWPLWPSIEFNVLKLPLHQEIL